MPGLTSQAQKIAAGLKPDPEDLEIVPVSDEDSEAGAVLQPSGRPYPTSGYIGPYPLREPKDADE